MESGLGAWMLEIFVNGSHYLTFHPSTIVTFMIFNCNHSNNINCLLASIHSIQEVLSGYFERMSKAYTGTALKTGVFLKASPTRFRLI